MSTTAFYNDGEIDVAAIRTFGASNKDKTKIGYFGTGLKYAIAILLREGHSVTLFRGETPYVFTTVPTSIGGKLFQVVAMNGEPLGFTTELGKNWDLWQAYRELYCNAIDEHGGAASTPIVPRPGLTLVVVTGAGIAEIHERRDQFFLFGQLPLFLSRYAEPHYGSGNIFYRGIQAMTPSKPTLYKWNIQANTALTENRTIQHEWEAAWAIARAVAMCQDRELITNVLTCSGDFYESRLAFDTITLDDEQHGVFISVVRERAALLDHSLNRSALAACRASLVDLIDDRAVALDPHQETTLKHAVDFCRILGYPVDQYKIIVADRLGDAGILGLAANGKIYLSTETFTRGARCVAGTLLEEYWHLSLSLRDETRQFQNHLVETVVSLGSRLTGKLI